MQFDGKRLTLWFLLYYLVIDVIRRIFESDSLLEVIGSHTTSRILMLTLSAGLFLYLITISSYTVFFRRKSKEYFLVSIFWVLVFGFILVTLRYTTEEVLFRMVFGFGNYKEGVSVLYYYLDNSYYVIQYGAIGIIFYFWQYSRFKDKSTHQLVVQNQQMELDLLRSQTNPHFLFNTLNNIYALVHNDSKKALEAIERLSQLLRYSLYNIKETVPLNDEIVQIRNFIALESIRHAVAPEVDIQLNIQNTTAQVPQFILLPFVENAFKHGKLNREAKPITICIEIQNGKLVYTVRNEIQEKKKDKIGGLGLDNLEKRLRLLYPNEVSFSCKVDGSVFIAQLKIPIL